MPFANPTMKTGALLWKYSCVTRPRTRFSSTVIEPCMNNSIQESYYKYVFRSTNSQSLHVNPMVPILSRINAVYFSFDATAQILALAYLHETLRFTSVLQILDSR
jgi:hypothetical protein